MSVSEWVGNGALVIERRVKAPLCAAAMALCSLWSAPARGAPSVDACIASYESSQELRIDKKLIEARAQAAVCMQDGCPQVARRHCADWLVELDRAIPTVVVKFVDATGQRHDVVVKVNGQVLVAELDGTAVELDPGTHVFHFEPAGSASVDREFTVLEGTQGQLIEVDVAPVPPEPHDRDEATVHPAAWVLGGVGIASLAVATGFWVHSLGNESCKPSCNDEQVDGIVRERLVGDITGAIGGAALAAAAVVAIWSVSREVEVAVRPGGAQLSWRF